MDPNPNGPLGFDSITEVRPSRVEPNKAEGGRCRAIRGSEGRDKVGPDRLSSEPFSTRTHRLAVEGGSSAGAGGRIADGLLLCPNINIRTSLQPLPSWFFRFTFLLARAVLYRIHSSPDLTFEVWDFFWFLWNLGERLREMSKFDTFGGNRDVIFWTKSECGHRIEIRS